MKKAGCYSDQEWRDADGMEGVLTPLLKEFLERALEGELEAHIEENEKANRKNDILRSDFKPDTLFGIYPRLIRVSIFNTGA